MSLKKKPPLSPPVPTLGGLLRVWLSHWTQGYDKIGIAVFTAVLAATLTAVCAVVFAYYVEPSDKSLISATLANRRELKMPVVKQFVDRFEVSLIVDVVENGSTFVMLDGANHAGKTIVAAAAAARLSQSRTVLTHTCTDESSLNTVLRSLYGTERIHFRDELARRVGARERRPANVQKLLLSNSIDHDGPEPVLVVEKAETMRLGELKKLLEFAKDLADQKLGRFIIVFSPSAFGSPDKLGDLAGLAAMYRAKVVSVLDLTRSETLLFLSTCPRERATVIFDVVGGHMPHLLEDVVPNFCAGATDVHGFTDHYTAMVNANLKFVETQIPCRAGQCACAVMCAIVTGEYDNPLFLKATAALLKINLIRASLTAKVFVIDAPFVHKYIEQRCHCSKSTTWTLGASYRYLLPGP